MLASSKSNFYFDSDSDNYGDLLIPLAACNTPVGYVSNSTDCNDNLAAINPGATEVCDSSNVDEDCDGLSDDADITVEPSSYSLWYRDADGDNYGLTASTTYTCDLPSGYTSVGGDCNDSSSSISPAATEICDSGNVDENCNGSADDNDSTVNAATKSTWYRDADTDTYGLSSESISRCDLPAGYVANSTDCDDAQSTVNPGITESPTYCKDGLDNDCDNVDDCRDVGLLVDTAADVTLLGINGSPSAAAFFAGTVARGEYDVTGDGYGDLAIGDREFDPTTAAGDANKGRMYLLRGGASGLQDTVAAPRATMNGVANADRAGSGLSFVTDINNDGVDELAVGAYLANPSVSGSALTDAGAAYLFKGSSSLTGTLSPTVNSTAPASAFISITGAVTKDYAGWAIADGGDLTGDFVNDWVVAGYAPTVVAGNTNIGRVAVISGTASSGTWTISSTTQNAAVISGAASGDRLGVSVVGNTDLDGDGLNELLATSAQLGITYIFEAPLSGSLTPVNASASLTGHDIVVSSVFEVNCSPCISSIGDSDGDEYEDLVVGADGYDTTGATNKGAAYLVRGGSSLPNGSVATLSVAQVYGSISSDFAGRAVGGGDFDGNGLGDMVVGASGFDSPLVGAASNTGAAVIIYGPATGSYSVSSLSGSNYAAWLGSSSSANLGAEVGGVGDLNGDGFDDWFLGAPNYNPGVRVGQGYLFYGVGE